MNNVTQLYQSDLSKPEGSEEEVVTPTPQVTAPPGGPDGTFGERLARLEGVVDGLRHSQDVMLAVMIGGFGIVFVVIMAFGIYGLQKIDSLPDEFLKINETLSSAITATKQQSPQVILLPAPQPSQAAPVPKAR